MNRSKNPRLKPLFLGLLFSTVTAFMSSCSNPNKPDQAGTGQQSTTTKTNSKANIQDQAVTLPVLDALFYEEGFEGELKSKLQLTDPQIQKLKAAAHESVAELTEEGTGNYLGSSRGVAKRSDEQIRGILGDDKANQLYQMVSQRYASGDVEGLMPTEPNAVPKDTRVVVNAAAYRMDVFQDGKLLKTYRVGIGYPEFPLPTGMRRAEQIIFNPTWTPPDEPWVKGKVQAGQKVAAGSKLNPLGPIKIPIGSPSLIHGGKAVAKLGNFASHGCVGLTNAQVQDFAGMLSQLSGSGITPDSILGFQEKKTQTKTVKLSKAVPVELRYETIVAENGGLRIFRDVYERGTNNLENAKRVLAVYGVKYESLNPQEQSALNEALDEMNHDPQGHPINSDNESAATTSNDTGNANGERKDGVAPSKQQGAKKGKVTYTIVGQKEVAVPIGALKGKGYPVPVNFNTGSANNTPATAKR